jgi:phospholipid transport system substrate-binding protein
MSRLAAAFALVLFICPGVWASTPTDALQQVFARADRILTDPDTQDRPLERLLGIRKLVNEAFDFRSAAELASGEHWRARTAAEQEEFTWLFADLLERSFVARMAAKANLTGGTRITYLDESVEGGTARVQTAMGRKGSGELLLDYRLIERDGAWKIRDVAIDGVSMMANYRAQLDRVLGTASFPDLLTQMRGMVGTVEPSVEAAHTVAASPSIVEASLPAEQELSADVPAPLIAVADASPPGPRVAAIDPVRASPPVEPPQAHIAPEVLTTPPAATPAARTPTTKAYWLKISTVEVAEAGRLVSRLRDGKHSVAFERTSVSGKPMVHVSVGPFEDAEEAVVQLLDLQTKGHDPFLVAERE